MFSVMLRSELESKFHGGNAIYVKISENFSWGGYKRNTWGLFLTLQTKECLSICSIFQYDQLFPLISKQPILFCVLE